MEPSKFYYSSHTLARDVIGHTAPMLVACAVLRVSLNDLMTEGSDIRWVFDLWTRPETVVQFVVGFVLVSYAIGDAVFSAVAWLRRPWTERSYAAFDIKGLGLEEFVPVPACKPREPTQSWISQFIQRLIPTKIDGLLPKGNPQRMQHFLVLQRFFAHYDADGYAAVYRYFQRYLTSVLTAAYAFITCLIVWIASGKWGVWCYSLLAAGVVFSLVSQAIKHGEIEAEFRFARSTAAIMKRERSDAELRHRRQLQQHGNDNYRPQRQLPGDGESV